MWSKGVDPAVCAAVDLHPLEEFLSVVEALTSLGDGHIGVFDQASNPPDAVLKDRFETIRARCVIETQVGKIEVGLFAVPQGSSTSAGS